MDAERYVTATGAADLVGLSADRVRKLGHSGDLERVTDPSAVASVGRRPGAPIKCVYRLAEIERFAASRGRADRRSQSIAPITNVDGETGRVALAVAEKEIDRLRNEVERLRGMVRAAIVDPVFDAWDEAPPQR